MKALRRSIRSASTVTLHLIFVAVASVSAQETGGFALTPGQDITQDWYSGSYALLIGVSNYTHGWQDLPSIPSELAAVEAELRRHGFTVEKHLDPSSREMKAHFESFIHRYGLESGHRLVFFFSGHGYTRTAVGRQKGYLVPRDAPLPGRSEREFLAKALPISQLVEWSKSSIEAGHALFLFDSCFSGTVFKFKGGPRKVPASITARMAKPVRQFISAGSADEKVPARSDFTPLFVRGLAGDADRSDDGYVTASELGAYLLDTITNLEKGQTPQYGKIQDVYLSAGDVVFRVPYEPPLVAAANDSGPRRRLDSAGVKGVEEPTTRLHPFRRWLDRLQERGPEMIGIPGGTFHMGSKEGSGNELPVHSVTVAPFEMSKTEVTVAQYRACVEAEACVAPSEGDSCNWGEDHRDDHPVNCVSWADAKQYAAWRKARLPSEAEWEYAARSGGLERKYPWGSEAPDCQRAIVSDGGLGCGEDRTWPVCSKPLGNTEQGLCDMGGNVYEWVEDDSHNSYKGAPTDEQPWIDTPRGENRVIRGGSWRGYPQFARVANRFRRLPSSRSINLGFRVARSLPSSS